MCYSCCTNIDFFSSFGITTLSNFISLLISIIFLGRIAHLIGEVSRHVCELLASALFFKSWWRGVHHYLPPFATFSARLINNVGISASLEQVPGQGDIDDGGLIAGRVVGGV